jgi:GNAT superfamily N-acetyltransferase
MAGASMRGAAFAVSAPAPGLGAPAERILRALPQWFAIEDALVAYARAAEELPTLAATHEGEVVGFLTLKRTSVVAMEIHVMAVLPAWHRCGIGRTLVEHACRHARADGCAYIHVKTLAPGEPYPPYDRTRQFYESVGLAPLEVLPQVWGPDDPCLLMVMAL